MALKPQRLSQLQELLAAGFVRAGTAGELYDSDGSPLAPNGLSQGVAVPNAAGGTPTGAEFNALLTSLRNAGIIAT